MEVVVWRPIPLRVIQQSWCAVAWLELEAGELEVEPEPAVIVILKGVLEQKVGLVALLDPLAAREKAHQGFACNIDLARCRCLHMVHESVKLAFVQLPIVYCDALLIDLQTKLLYMGQTRAIAVSKSCLMKSSSVKKKQDEVRVLISLVVLNKDVLSSVTQLSNLAQVLIDDPGCFVYNGAQRVINTRQHTAFLVGACQLLAI